jgi:DNA-binding beta-propeller fold protein YncE
MYKIFLKQRFVQKVFLCTFSIIFPLFVNAQGFPNVTQPAEGTLLQGPIGQQMGRLAIIEIIGDYVITIPEAPGSEGGDDLQMRAWDISDPTNPREVANFGSTLHGFNAHATMKRGNDLFLGSDTAVRVDSSGNLQRVSWVHTNTFPWNSSAMYAPWGAQQWWSYGAVSGDAFLELDGERTATWDHLSLTGVIGFPRIMGNILIYASDQSLSGIAAYDISDPSNPQLLDVLNTPANEAGGGIGGYWNEIYGNYIVFARRWNNGIPNSFSGIQVVDFSDPSNLRLHCNVFYGTRPGMAGYSPELDWADPMYVGFQDEYVFTERFKIRLEDDGGDNDPNTGCSTELILPVTDSVETSQYSRPIGNLMISGGYPAPAAGSDGMGIWVHQSAPDTRGPFVSYHVPRANQTGYPVMAPISVHIPETLRSETIITTETPELGATETLTLVEVGGGPVRIDYILNHTGMLTIDPVDYLEPNTTYELRLTSGIRDAVGNSMQAYSFRFSTGNAVSDAPTPDPGNGVTPPVLDGVTVSPSGLVEIGNVVTVTASASDNSSETIEYLFEQEGGQPGVWSSSNMATFDFAATGNYTINVRARNSAGQSSLNRVAVNVVSSSQVFNVSRSSSQLYCAANSGSVWAVNPDNDSVTIIDAANYSVDVEHFGVDDPRSVAVSPNGNVWVTSHSSDRVDVFDGSGNRIRQIDTGYGSAPFGMVISPDGASAYASLYGSGEIVRFNAQTLQESGRISVGPTPRALALTPDGGRLLATRFISAENWGEVWDINTANFSLTRTIRLDKNLDEDDVDQGRGVPNYLSSIIINDAGTRAYVVGKKDNTDRGLLNGLATDLDDDNTVRTIALTIDLGGNQELKSERVDFDNTDSPSSLAFSTDESMLFVGMQGINQVFGLDINNGRLGAISTQISVGHAPQGLCVDGVSRQLFVKNFTDRSVSAVDISQSLVNPTVVNIETVSNEMLATDVLAGKRIFYDAANGRLSSSLQGKMSGEGYISCATCHIDGGHDGRTYDFTGRGEGIRNNISLKGRSGTRFGNVHWTANFDEIQDFEHDIRSAFRGRGFISDADFSGATPLGSPKAGLSEELDQLAAYVSSLGQESLPRSPYREANGVMTDAGQRGRELFNSLNCGSCHSGDGFTDGLAHDVGTLREYSGARLGEVIPGIKTPSLLGVFDSAPYMHDGSAKTLADVFATVGGIVYQAEGLQGLNTVVSQMDDNFSFLRGGEAARLNNGGYIDIPNVEGGSGGPALIRIRYGSVQGSAILGVWREENTSGIAPMLSLSEVPQVDGQDVAFTESHAVELELAAGTNNTIRIWVDSLSGGSNIIIDDITVSNADDVVAASAHTVARDLSASESNDLQQYILQIDRLRGATEPSPAPSGSGSSGANPEDEGSGGSLGLAILFLISMLLILREYPMQSLRTRSVKVRKSLKSDEKR